MRRTRTLVNNKGGVKMSVEIELQGIDEALKNLNPEVVKKATVSAVNKMADQAKTQTSKMVREGYNIAPSRLNKYLYVAAKASANNIVSTIIGRGRGLALSYFGAKQVGVVTKKTGSYYNRRAIRDTSGKRRGGQVTVEVKRGSRKVVSGEPKRFMITTKAGHIGVFHRESSKRLPLNQEFGPGIGGLFGSKMIMPRVKSFINEKFIQIFQHELKWRSSKK